MTNERDTHFLNFAKLLWREMLDLHGYIDERDHSYGANESPEYELLIAQRAYDLIWHLYDKTTPRMIDKHGIKVLVDSVPDLTEWPPIE